MRSAAKLSAVALALLSVKARAWESSCQQYADVTLPAESYSRGRPCEPSEGPNVARHRWVGGLDEHRQLWERAREKAGIPALTSATSVLRVFTSTATVKLGKTTAGSFQPVPFEKATRVQVRGFTPGELTQLPDFSFALWDWATGNETCPLPGSGADPQQCHDFASHMGPVNSNHFVPQAGASYARYHQLALDRAAQCAVLKAQVQGTGGRFEPFLKACELEALAIEAVGQHFLQDAWSMGHMWQRWGSHTLSDFPGQSAEEQRQRAVLIALVSGLYHGARGVLQVLPAWTSFNVNDAMCAPWNDVQFVLPGGAVTNGVGDDYLGDLLPSGAQATRFLSCAASGMTQVYQVAGQNHGPQSPPSGGLSSVNPTGPECFGQRATNAAMLRGAAIDLKLAGAQMTLPIDARLVSWMLPQVAAQQGQVSVSPALRNEFRVSVQKVVTLTRLLAKADPLGTQAAEGQLGELLGAKPNGAAASLGTPAYQDPALPWPATVDPQPEAKERATALARVFHRAHAADWCQRFTAADLSALKARTSDPALDAPGRQVACEVCAELTERHLRVGTPAAYDGARQPLCHHVATAPPYAYQPPKAGADTHALAYAWCGC